MPQATSPNTITTATAPSRLAYEHHVLVTLAGLFATTAANDAEAFTLTACPCCGTTPTTEPSFHKRAVVFCDNDDCGERPQAMGDTVALAAANWNQRIADGDLV